MATWHYCMKVRKRFLLANRPYISNWITTNTIMQLKSCELRCVYALKKCALIIIALFYQRNKYVSIYSWQVQTANNRFCEARTTLIPLNCYIRDMRIEYICYSAHAYSMPELISTPPNAILQGTCPVTGYHNCSTKAMPGTFRILIILSHSSLQLQYLLNRILIILISWS